MSSRHSARPHAPSRGVALAAASLGLGLALAPPAASANTTDTGTYACPGSPSSALDPLPPAPPAMPVPVEPVEPDDDGVGTVGLGVFAPPGADGADPMAVMQLLPGTNRVTPGEPLSPHLNGPAILSQTVTFSFLDHDNHVVSGHLSKKVVNADNKTCDYYWTASVDSSSSLGIDRLIVNAFPHPVHGLYGDWRNDLVPGGVGSDHVKRSSGSGTTITFRIGAVVLPSQSSRPLMLDSAVGLTTQAGTVQLRATDGSLSAPIPTWVPVWP
jgi:hypothetical protein